MSQEQDPTESWGRLGNWVAKQQAQFADPTYIAESEVAVNFTLNIRQNIKVRVWYAEHQKTCPITNHGSIGGAVTFSFTPTSVGTVEKVACTCGAYVDVTDYQEW